MVSALSELPEFSSNSGLRGTSETDHRNPWDNSDNFGEEAGGEIGGSVDSYTNVFDYALGYEPLKWVLN